MADDLNRIRGILGSQRKQLLKRANVVATGIGFKQTGGVKTEALCIVCSVKKKVPPSQLTVQDLVPAVVEGPPPMSYKPVLSARFRHLPVVFDRPLEASASGTWPLPRGLWVAG